MKKLFWILWLMLTLAGIAYYLYVLLAKEDKSELLIGEATHGHYQIEMACNSCHTDAFGGQEILQNACMNCHEQELKDAFDSHPKKKFTDPRNADLIEVIDARYCVSCHTEHQQEQTGHMGLTLPDDYCFHCHTDIGEERESHQDLPFDSCASAGCHNYHDNRALYEAFLVENANQPWLNEIAQIGQANHAKLKAKPQTPIFEAAGELVSAHPDIHAEWSHTAHATAGVSCVSCHNDSDKQWIEKPGIKQCQSCHQKEAEGFSAGKHGMKLAIENKAIQAGDALLKFHNSALENAQGCNSCHSAHSFDRKQAATESCLNCHADEHSLAFNDSAHGQLWAQELAGTIPEGEGVSCATCHMPRIKSKQGKTTLVHIEHNQNKNLRPNEKMIRPVCMQCHGLEFSIDALADKALIKNNFNGAPSKHIESIDWALEREKR